MQQRIPSVGLCVNNLKVPGRIKLVHQQSPKAFFDSFERVLNFEVVIVCIRAVCLCNTYYMRTCVNTWVGRFSILCQYCRELTMKKKIATGLNLQSNRFALCSVISISWSLGFHQLTVKTLCFYSAIVRCLILPRIPICRCKMVCVPWLVLWQVGL